MNTLVFGAALIAVAVGQYQVPQQPQAYPNQPYTGQTFPGQSVYPQLFPPTRKDNVWCDHESFILVTHQEETSVGNGYGGRKFFENMMKEVKCSSAAWFDEKSCTSCCRMAVRLPNDVSTLEINGMVVEVGDEPSVNPGNPTNPNVYGQPQQYRNRRQAESNDKPTPAQSGYHLPESTPRETVVGPKKLQCICCRPAPPQHQLPSPVFPHQPNSPY